MPILLRSQAFVAKFQNLLMGGNLKLFSGELHMKDIFHHSYVANHINLIKQW